MKTLHELSQYAIKLKIDLGKAERDLKAGIESDPKLKKLLQSIERIKASDEVTRLELLELMRAEEVQNVKLEQGTAYRSLRQTLEVEPDYKKKVEHLLKAGETVKNFRLKESEFVAIRLA